MTFKLNPHKVFKCNKKEYLFVAETGALFELDKESSFLIKQDGSNFESIKHKMFTKFSSSSEKVEQILDDFRIAKLLGSITKPVVFDYSLGLLHSIELMVCQCCNLACTYCYATEGEYHNPGWMSEEIGKKAIDFLFAHAKNDSVSISFFGGEPLINLTLIKKLVQYANKKALVLKKRVSYSLTTNGTLINRDTAEFLNKNKFYVSLSIDGNQQGHDLCRIDKKGHGSYVNSIKNIDLLNDTLMSFRATATPHNSNYIAISEALYNLKETDFYIGEAMNCFITDNSLRLVEKSYKDLIEQFMIDLEQDRIKKCKVNSLIYQNLKKIAFFEQRSCSCSAFISSVAVDVNGIIYPCHRFVGSAYCIGNINEKGIDIKVANKMFPQDFLINYREGCSVCWVQNLCVGGCSYLNMETNGQSNIPNKYKCRLNKYLYEKLIILFINLTYQQKKSLSLIQ